MHSFSQLFVFGDSLSDCGRTMENLQLDPGQLGGSYYQYRYSDGPIYLDQLCLRLGLPSPNVTNVFARGSATTDSGWCQVQFPNAASAFSRKAVIQGRLPWQGISDLTGEPVPGVVQQVAAYLSEVGGFGAFVSVCCLQLRTETEWDLVQRAGCADPDACHIVWVGINDYYFHLVDKRYAACV
jgi:phospholipase/lecithinase/hemolysin